MSAFNSLRKLFFKDDNDQDMGQRAEILVTLTLAVLSTLLPVAVYRNPITLTISVITNAVGLFTLYQAFRERYKYLPLFPIVTSFAVCGVTIIEGAGTHDLLWMGNLGLFLLANIHSKKNLIFPVYLALLMIATFTATGIAEIYGPLTNEYGTTVQYIYLNSFFFATMMAAIIAIFHRHYTLLQIAIDSKSAQTNSNLELQKVNQTLESRVETRTRELKEANEQTQARAMRLQTISEISREISFNTERPLQGLLDYITEIISEKLGFYHVGIFLLDENREYAVLRAANSEGGKRMLERRHQLRVGGTGIVGYVSQSGRPRIALETGSDAVFFNNPDLPETHSEMAIPLKYGMQMIGALDIQSALSAAFKEEDVNLLSTLANQIAIAINNALINDRSGLDLRARNRGGIYRRQFARHKQNGYTFGADGSIATAKPSENPIIKKALSTGEAALQDRPSRSARPAMAIPVKFRERTIGVIHIESAEESRKWTENEIMVVQSVADRAAFALENARLFEETSRRAEQEETIARITSQIGASTDFNRILQTTVEELGRTLGTTHAFIQMEAPDSENAPVASQRATD